MRMVLLGPPGSDKGDFAVKLAEKYDIVLLTIAEMLADAVERRLEVGIQAQAYLEHGQYIPDELLLEVIADRMAQSDVKSGFVLVGFPRSTAQADGLDELLQNSGMALDLALHLNVEDELLLERLEGRRTCISCGMRYNIFTNPPMVHGVCDMCGGRVGRGADSNEVVISNRLRAYEQQIHSLVSYYLLHDKLREVEASGTPKEVTNLLYQAVEEWTRSQAEKAQALMAKVEEVAEAAAQEQQTNESAPDAVAEETPPVAKKKAVIKKSTAKKKAPAKKKAAVKKPTTKKKAVAKKSTTKKKVVAKKPTTKKKAVAKKPTTKKKAVAKKPTTKKKAAVKKTLVKKKTAAKKQAPVKKKTTIKKKVVAKKSTAKKVPAKKTTAKKTPAKKKGKKR